MNESAAPDASRLPVWGWRLTSAVPGKPDFAVNLDATCCGAAGDDAVPENAIRLELRIPFMRWDAGIGRSGGPGSGSHRATRPDARVAPGPKCGGHPTPHSTSPARVPGAAAVGRAGDVRPRDVYRLHRGGRHGSARAGPIRREWP